MPSVKQISTMSIVTISSSIFFSASCNFSSMGCAARSHAGVFSGLDKRDTSRRFTIYPIFRHHNALSMTAVTILRGGSEDLIAPAEAADILMTKRSHDFTNDICANAGSHSCRNPFTNFDEEIKSHDDLMYTTIGILDLCPKAVIHWSNTGFVHRDDKILVCFIDSDSSINHMEWWKLIDSDDPNCNSVKSMGDSENFQTGGDLKHAVNAQIMGSLCDAIVLNFSSFRELLVGMKLGSEHLDECLLCIAEGVLRRVNSIDHNAMREVDLELNLVVAFNDNVGITDLETREVEKYLQHFLKYALYCLSRDHHDSDVVKSIPRCRFNVIWSKQSATDAMLDIVAILRNKGNLAENLVPRSAFGILATQLGDRISKQLASSCTRRRMKISKLVWINMSEQHYHVTHAKYHDEMSERDTSIVLKGGSSQSSSDIFKLMVQDLMAREFVSAEESLLEIENEMDRSFLEGTDGEVPMSDFRRDADAILDAVSKSFSDLIDEAGPVMKADQDWAESQRIVTLRHVAGDGLLRLFRLHLQNLRDHFGRQFEKILDDSIAAGIAYEGEWEKARRDAAKIAEEGFVKAAFSSIPQMCRYPDGELSETMAVMYGCTDALRGLLEDMFYAKSSRGLEEDELKSVIDINDNDRGSLLGVVEITTKSRVGLRQLIKNIKTKARKNRPCKWYEKLARKAMMIAINYFQGWIVLQSLRREARKRDLTMPKFPLF